ncbi:hypothetical protein GK091_29325, partial [Spirosoma agri]|nr:hypothetical protein [Spirosoma agri]
RVDGKSQTLRLSSTSDYQSSGVGSYTLTAGVHTIGLSSGVDEGYICFDQVCAKPVTAEAPCVAPAAPVISVSGGGQICNGSSVSLTASGCSGTVTWSTGDTGSSLSVKTAGDYTASCQVGGCRSSLSNTL